MSKLYSNQIRLRPFQPKDLEPVVALWNACLPKDPISVERFWRLFLLDPNFRPEGVFVAEFEQGPIGFLQAMVRRTSIGIFPADPAQGWITTFFVGSEFRRRGIGRSLVQAGLHYFRQHGCRSIMCNGYAPYYAFPGVDVEYVEALALMDSMGFRPLTEAVAMVLPLKDVRTPPSVVERRASLAAAGTVVRQFGFADTLPLLIFAEKHFPYWHQSLVDGLQQRSHDVFVALRGDEVVGFAQWQNPLTDPPSGALGRFGPFGVHPDLRGNGLGAVIFYTLIENVVGDGVENLWFGWAGGRNQSFYQRAGCRITRRYQMFNLDFANLE